MNSFGKLRRCTEELSRVVDFHLCLSAAIVTLRMLIRRATAGMAAPPPSACGDAY